MAASANKVVIIGAGMAGMSAALRLLERGFEVTLYEQDDFVGGMMHSFQDPISGEWREHSYHMMSNWYHNFWKITEELGVRDNFEARDLFKYLYQGEFPEMTELMNAGAPQDLWKNIFSGAAEPSDLFIYMYSQVDLLSRRIDIDKFLDHYSVNGFMRSRPYATEGAAEIHQQLWETVWAVPSFNASAKSYQTFLKYGNKLPVPDYWMFKMNKWDGLLKAWMEKLNSYDTFTLKRLHRLKKIVPSEDRTHIKELIFQKVDKSPSVYVTDESAGVGVGDGEGWKFVGRSLKVDVTGDSVIAAVTPGMMAELAQGDLYNADPLLGEIQYLEAEPMGSVDLHLNREIPGMPRDIVVLMDAEYEMTFIDYCKTWPNQPLPYICVTVSDAKSLCAIPVEDRDTNGDLVIDLKRPKTAIDYILNQLFAQVPITLDDVNLRKTCATMNTGEELFANLVGSWDKRPEATTGLDNLFLAGTYVRHYADVATVEGGVASGLQAAEAVRLRHGVAGKIEVIEADEYPTWFYKGLKVLWAPYAAYAKAWSMGTHALGLTRRPPRHWKLLDDKGSFDFGQAAKQWAELLSGRAKGSGSPSGQIWNYNPDGKTKRRSRRKTRT